MSRRILPSIIHFLHLIPINVEHPEKATDNYICYDYNILTFSGTPNQIFKAAFERFIEYRLDILKTNDPRFEEVDMQVAKNIELFLNRDARYDSLVILLGYGIPCDDVMRVSANYNTPAFIFRVLNCISPGCKQYSLSSSVIGYDKIRNGIIIGDYQSVPVGKKILKKTINATDKGLLITSSVSQ